MKIDKSLPALTPVDPHGRRYPVAQETVEGKERKKRPETEPAPRPAVARDGARRSGYSVQLNRQLSAMQSAESYLSDLAARLGHLKVLLGRQLSAASGMVSSDEVQSAGAAVQELLGERNQRTAGSLDADLGLHLNEPARTRFTIAGLENPETIQAAGRETLVFRVGRAQAEPRVVVLDDTMTPEQMLRRFNAALATTGVRSELDDDGRLRFSARESDWQSHGGTLYVRGEGRLFPDDGAVRAQTREQGLIRLDGIEDDSVTSTRRVLDNVVQALDRIARLSDQIAQRQDEIRDFLARQVDADEGRWANEYTRSVYGLLQRAASDYTAVSEMIVAQSNLNRFAVVSLLS